ncbi:MAG: aldose 1-epimerase family protein [Bacteroidia bacterium]
MEKTQIFGLNTSFSINKKGAELCSVKDKLTDYEFIWQADPQVWPRYAPVLFPFVGKSALNQFSHCGKLYEMGQHGFARDHEFEINELYTDLVSFSLKGDAQRFPQFPFPFIFNIIYQVIGDDLKISYTTFNPGSDTLYFSVGAHPGFKLPVSNLSQYKLEFEAEENLETHLLKDGLFTGETLVLASASKELQLNKEIFEKDALVFKGLHSKKLSLKHLHSNYSIEMEFDGFPFMGIWAKVPNEDFICLEPWHGLADQHHFKGDLSEKEGIIHLAPGETHELSYTIRFQSPQKS